LKSWWQDANAQERRNCGSASGYNPAVDPTILIVDDDPATLEGLTTLVEKAGYAVRSAADYAGGRRMLSQVAVDLLIVDVRLGAYNGLQLVVFSQSLPPSPPAIVTSGFEDRVLEEEARRLGAPFLLKPIDPPKLLNLIEEMLAKRKE
jgi:DNA-binding response OmpR family regulator